MNNLAYGCDENKNRNWEEKKIHKIKSKDA